MKKNYSSEISNTINNPRLQAAIFGGLLFLLLGIFSGCSKIYLSNEQISRDIKQIKSKIETLGGVYKSGFIRIGGINNEVYKGQIDYQHAKEIRYDDRTVILIPFKWGIENGDGTIFKNRFLFENGLQDSIVSSYAIVLSTLFNGNSYVNLTQRRFIHRNSNRNLLKTGKSTLSSYYYTVFDNYGRTVKEILYNTKGEKMKFLSDVVTTESYLDNSFAKQISSASTSCETIITVSKFVSCSGPDNDVVCTFFNRTSTKYSCTFDYNANPGEVQGIPFEDSDGNGIVEWEEVVDELENQEHIDSLPGYPCAQEVLSHLPSCNATVAKMVTAIFNVSGEVNLKIKVDNTLTKDSLLSGYFRIGNIHPEWFTGTISLNPWELTNSTKEYIASTIIHEALHGVIGYWYAALRAGQIDSIEFKKKFPIFWDYKRQLYPYELSEHEEFAQTYVAQMSSYIKSFNAGISEDMATALAWGGLQGTTAWKKLGVDTLDIIQKNRIARRDQNPNDYSIYNLQKCL